MIRENTLLTLATLLATATTWGCANSSDKTQGHAEAAAAHADGRLLPEAKIAQAKADISILAQGLMTFFVANGSYPVSLEVLRVEDANGYSILGGDELPTDPWQNEYVYQPPVGEQEFNITSLGADGQPGGEGADADITLWDLTDSRDSAAVSDEVAAVRSDLMTIDAGLVTFAIRNGRYPDSLEVLIAKDRNGYRILDCEEVPKDPWQNEYVYQPPVGDQQHSISSLGADGQPGGEGEDADITLEDPEDC